MQQQQAQIDAAAQAALSAQAPAAPVAAVPAAGGTDIGTQLTQLASLHTAGVLSDEEFAASQGQAPGLSDGTAEAPGMSSRGLRS
ncbi:SHOCT domain-containing protein [Microbacterium elymi]|uniref:SHOCT domain-containing protein n=1 Tax=Microbacterium elymi TaxID=2909587 RepID=UPI00338E3D3F